MTENQRHLKNTAQLLTDSYLANYPLKAARELAKLPGDEAAALLAQQPANVVAAIFRYLPPGVGETLLPHWEPSRATALLTQLDVHLATSLLSRLSPEERENQLNSIAEQYKSVAEEFRDLLAYPEDTAGRLMDTRSQMFYSTLSVEEVIQQLRSRRPKKMDVLFLINAEQQLVGTLDIGDLILANPRDKAASLAKPPPTFLNTLDTKDDVVERFEGLRVSVVPVIDNNNRLAGVIRAVDIYHETKEDLASDIASMVGASKDEKALSSSWFAVKKRMPWLQINLLTAFAAAAVVGAFEGLIAQFTALAILLPVAAGQSGNAGAQALAVTMRGLTLKEITTRHWWRVLTKEAMAGFMNGVAIAITCAIGVWIWSRSLGLALVMILAMVASLTVACAAGALVPIVLKKLGQDPAQSSSIVLTTVTDIVGFLSFLGIATLFAAFLPTG